MTWHVFLTNFGDADLERFTEPVRNDVANALLDWTEEGPPRAHHCTLADAELWEHHLDSGIAVVYFIDDELEHVGVVGVRPP